MSRINLATKDDVESFVKGMSRGGTPTLHAKKNDYIYAEKMPAGSTLDVYTKNGNLEAQETVQEGNWVATRVNRSNGKPVIDENGHKNQWQVSDETLHKKYNVPENFEGGFVPPKGSDQYFMQVQDGVTIQVPWGENGSLIPQTIKAGGYLNITDMDDVYGIAEEEFNETYEVKGKILPSISLQDMDYAIPIRQFDDQLDV